MKFDSCASAVIAKGGCNAGIDQGTADGGRPQSGLACEITGGAMLLRTPRLVPDAASVRMRMGPARVDLRLAPGQTFIGGRRSNRTTG